MARTFKVRCRGCKIIKTPEHGDRCPRCNQLWGYRPYGKARPRALNCDMVDSDLCKHYQAKGKCAYLDTHNVICFYSHILQREDLKGKEARVNE